MIVVEKNDFTASIDFGEPRPGTRGKQPDRGKDDGAVGLKFDGETHLLLTATQDGVEGKLRVSIYNAWRIFGMLILALGVSVPKKLRKSIRLTEPMEASK